MKRTLEEFEKLGYDDAFIDEFGNVHGVIEGKNEDAGALMLNSHLDTVGPGDPSDWEHDPYAAAVEEDTLYGLGAADMKSAVAAMVYAGGAIANMDYTPEHTIYVTPEYAVSLLKGGVSVDLLEGFLGPFGAGIYLTKNRNKPQRIVINYSVNIGLIHAEKLYMPSEGHLFRTERKRDFNLTLFHRYPFYR